MNKRKQKEHIKENIKDFLKMLLLSGIVTTLWIIASLLASLI